MITAGVNFQAFIIYSFAVKDEHRGSLARAEPANPHHPDNNSCVIR